MTGKLSKMLVILATLVAAFLVVSVSAESKARIVRLSDVQGSVQIDRAAGQGFEKAFQNLPVVEGAKLKTGRDGRAEVEFEDGSSLRLAQDSEAEFPKLALTDDGSKLTSIKLISGVMYVHAGANKGDKLNISFGRESIDLADSAHFRIDFADTDATLAVFKGKVRGTGPSGPFEVSEKHSATFDLVNNDSFAVNKNFDPDPNDAWDKQQTDYHDRYAKSGYSDLSSPYGYGLADLNYYGNYFNCAGFGYGWQPFLVDASWSPFADGAWAWYPGFGYTWVSSYPWGWTPYRYGSWGYASGCGWMWQPGLWTAWYPVPVVVNPPVRTPLPKPPIRGTTMVMVGRGLIASPANPPSHLRVNPGSAGLGIPRGSIANFDHVAKEAGNSSRPVVVHSRTSSSTSYPSMNQGWWGSAASSGHGSYSGGHIGGPSHTSASAPSRPH